MQSLFLKISMISDSRSLNFFFMQQIYLIIGQSFFYEVKGTHFWISRTAPIGSFCVPIELSL